MTIARWHSLGASLLVAVLALAFAWIPQAQAADDFDSLYAAIAAANRNGSGSITLSQLISLGEPLPPIDSVIIIDGGGQTISGAWLYRIFDIDGGALTLKDLRLSAGKAPTGESGGLIPAAQWRLARREQCPFPIWRGVVGGRHCQHRRQRPADGQRRQFPEQCRRE